MNTSFKPGALAKTRTALAALAANLGFTVDATRTTESGIDVDLTKTRTGLAWQLSVSKAVDSTTWTATLVCMQLGLTERVQTTSPGTAIDQVFTRV